MSQLPDGSKASAQIEERVKEIRFKEAIGMGSGGMGASVSRLALHVADPTLTRKPDVLTSLRIIGPGVWVCTNRGDFLVPWARIDCIETFTDDEWKAKTEKPKTAPVAA